MSCGTSDDLYGFLSFWGHLLVVDASHTGIRFRPLLGRSNGEIATFRRDPDPSDLEHSLWAIEGRSAHVPSWKVCAGSLAGCVSLVEAEKWIGADKDGRIFRAENKQEWENFYPISLNDIQILGSLLLSRFRIPGAGDLAPKLGLDEFSLIWGGYRFPLHLNCPISQRFDDGICRFDTGNEVLILEQFKSQAPQPSIWLSSLVNIGNRALQYLTAEGIKEHAPDARILNTRLEMFGIDQPAPRPANDSCAGTGMYRYSIDTQGLGACLRRGEVESIAIDSYTFSVDHYPSREKCRSLLPVATGADDVSGFGEQQLLCNVRGDEILRGEHLDYIPMPAGYYKLLEQETGLELVFYGQIGDDPYSESLRQHFPRARFIASRGPAIDFETIRRSKNIAVCISTFSWLAAWLSRARRIYVPIGGMFNPVQHPDQNYLPVDDPAFRFVLFPHVKTVNLYERPTEFWQIQERISKFARFATHSEIQELLARVTTAPRTKRVMAGAFDQRYYCNRYLDAAADVLALRATALDHYLRCGDYCDQIVAFDEQFYGAAYPDAETDVALGRFSNLLNHFIRKGWYLGYRNTDSGGSTL